MGVETCPDITKLDEEKGQWVNRVWQSDSAVRITHAPWLIIALLFQQLYSALNLNSFNFEVDKWTQPMRE